MTTKVMAFSFDNKAIKNRTKAMIWFLNPSFSKALSENQTAARLPSSVIISSRPLMLATASV